MSPVELEQKRLQTADDLESLRIGIKHYMETMHTPPAELSDLWVKGSQPDFAFDPVHNVGAGWIGPYITDDIAEHLNRRNEDRFGRLLRYAYSPFIRIQSAGADGVFDNTDDLICDVMP